MELACHKKYQSAKSYMRIYWKYWTGNLLENGGHWRLWSVQRTGSGAVCQKIGKERQGNGEVLLVSLTEFSTFLPQDKNQNGIGEWFYYQMRQQEGRRRISDWVYSEDNMDF